MTSLGAEAYLAHLHAESTRFADVIAACPPDARVPSCPDWDAADLLWHLAGVQHFWHHVATTRPAAPDDYAEPERPASYDGLLELFHTCHGRLVDALAAAEPTESAWTWSPDAAHHTVGFVHRRQAHEALIHRVDAELVAGDVTSMPADLAADGVEEALDVMYGGLPPWGRFDPLDRHVEYRITDTGTSVWARLGHFSGTSPEGEELEGERDQHVVAAPDGPADLVISGTAHDLDGWLWHRLEGGVTFVGDREVESHVRAVLDQPID